MTIRLDDIDLRLLRLFMRVVQCGGFTAAHAELGLSQSTISTRMAELEGRLRLRLCQRGRRGFALTEDGRRVHEACLRLLGAVEGFRSEVASWQGRLAGELRLGVVDNTVTNPVSRLPQAIERLRALGPDVHISLQVAAPTELERAVLDGRLDLAIGAFHRHLPGFDHAPLFSEPQGLYCGRGHALFARPDHAIGAEELADADYAARAYMPEPDQARWGLGRRSAASSYHMEGLAILVLSGRYLGFLPTHYAERWARASEMRALLPARFGHDSLFERITRRNAEPSQVTRTFLRILDELHTPR